MFFLVVCKDFTVLEMIVDLEVFIFLLLSREIHSTISTVHNNSRNDNPLKYLDFLDSMISNEVGKGFWWVFYDD